MILQLFSECDFVLFGLFSVLLFGVPRSKEVVNGGNQLGFGKWFLKVCDLVAWEVPQDADLFAVAGDEKDRQVGILLPKVLG